MSAAGQSIEMEAYDEVPYDSFSYPITHARHLWVVASLFGLTPPDFRTARVLEIGCASGGNLFSAALAYPEAHFTGIDLSQEQVNIGLDRIKELGLKNMVLEQQDLMKFNLKKNKGAFDYIICHGVFSWVPEEVGARILDLCRECLSEHGVAVISYNTLPGWNAVRSLREMMLFHTKRFTKPSDKVQQARSLLNFLAENVSESRASYRKLIEDERALLAKTNDSYIFHDHLENTNRQLYLHEFDELLRRHGLSYVGDSAPATMFIGNMPPKAFENLKAVNDAVLQEQYMDFITNRRFRTSVLCKAPGPATRTIPGERIFQFCMTTNITAEGDIADFSKPVTFRRPEGSTISTHDIVTATLLLELIDAGRRPISAQDLVKKNQEKLKLKTPEAIEKVLVDSFMHLMLRGFITLHADTPYFVSEVSERPVANRLARLQAQEPNCTLVTNALHGMTTVDPFVVHLLPHLDGTKTLPEIAVDMARDAASGKFNIFRNGEIVKDEAEMREQLPPTINEVMKALAREGVLVG